MSTAAVTSIFSARETMTRTLASIEGSTRRLDKAFGSLRGRLRSAIEFTLVSRGMDMRGRALRRVEELLPSLIQRGERWAETVDGIVDATGMAARQASELAAVNQRVGGTSEALVRGMAAMAKTVYTARDSWKELGVEVALNRDGSVNAYQTFQNLRRAIADTGGSLLSTSAAQKLLSRSGKDLLDLLQLTDGQYRRLARDAQASGQVMSEAALRAAEAWGRAQQRFGAVLDGLGTKLLSNLAPVLTRFVDGFSSFLQRNMDNIVRFVVGGANTILTIIGDLIGIDLGQWSFTEEIENATIRTKRFGTALNDTSKAHQKAAKATKDNGREQKRLADELARAERALRNERSRSALFSRMSGVDAELWRQQKAARIKDAQDRVAEARKALTQHKQTMDRMGDQAEAAGVRIRRALFSSPTKSKGGKGGETPFGDMKTVLAESTKAGHQIAKTLKDAIFGKESILDLGSTGVVVRTGGLIGALQGVQKLLQTVSEHITNLNGLLGGDGPLVLGILALAKLLPIGGITGAAGAAGAAGGGSVLAKMLTPIAGATGIVWGVKLLAEAITGKKYDTSPNTGRTSFGPRTREQMQAFNEANGITDDGRGLGGGARASGSFPRKTGGVSGYWNDWWRMAMAGPMALPVRPTGGAGGTGGGAAGGFGGFGGAGGQFLGFGADPSAWMAMVFRRYLGPTSPLVLGQDDQSSTLGGIYGSTETTAGNTQAVADGQVGVNNPNFGTIGTIDKVTVSKVPVDASGRTLTVWTPSGKKLPTEGGGKGGSINLPLSYQTNIAQTRKYAAESRASLANIAVNMRSAVGQLDSIRKAVGGTHPNSSVRGGA